MMGAVHGPVQQLQRALQPAAEDPQLFLPVCAHDLGVLQLAQLLLQTVGPLPLLLQRQAALLQLPGRVLPRFQRADPGPKGLQLHIADGAAPVCGGPQRLQLLCLLPVFLLQGFQLRLQLLRLLTAGPILAFRVCSRMLQRGQLFLQLLQLLPLALPFLRQISHHIFFPKAAQQGCMKALSVHKPPLRRYHLIYKIITRPPAKGKSFSPHWENNFRI